MSTPAIQCKAYTRRGNPDPRFGDVKKCENEATIIISQPKSCPGWEVAICDDCTPSGATNLYHVEYLNQPAGVA